MVGGGPHLLQDHPLPGEGANVGHDDGRVVPGHVVPPQVVHHYEQDVGWASCGAFQEAEEGEQARHGRQPLGV